MQRPSLSLVPTLLAPLVLASACGAPPSPRATAPIAHAGADDAAHAQAWEAWRARRRESLGGEDGWLTLVVLHWLDAPESTIGSDPGSTIVLPADRAPARVGVLRVEGGAATFVPEPGVEIADVDRPDAGPIDAATALVPDDPGPPTTLALGSLRMHVIARAGRLGLRVKDRASPARVGFRGPPVYERDLRLRVPARFVPAAEGEVLPIVNVLGQQVDEPLAGRLRFELEGRPLELLATLAGGSIADGLFVMFRDATSDAEDGSYPAGRYLEVEAPGAIGPDGTGEAWIDFNFAYTPPCGYTELATCPLPPPENELPIAIRAGERAPEGH